MARVEVMGVVTYRGGWMFFPDGVCAIFFMPAAVGAVVSGGSLLAALFMGVMATVLAVEASTHCHRVELRSDGALVLHYFVRPRLVTRASAVCSIERDDENGAWTVVLEQGRFRLSPNRSARHLVHALLRRQPTIALSGCTIPPL